LTESCYFNFIAVVTAVRIGTFLWGRFASPRKCPEDNGKNGGGSYELLITLYNGRQSVGVAILRLWNIRLAQKVLIGG
jgi:hypothetical protein